MAFGINVKEITAQFKDALAEVRADLRMIRETLDAILAELRTQRGAPQ